MIADTKGLKRARVDFDIADAALNVAKDNYDQAKQKYDFAKFNHSEDVAELAQATIDYWIEKDKQHD